MNRNSLLPYFGHNRTRSKSPCRWVCAIVSRIHCLPNGRFSRQFHGFRFAFIRRGHAARYKQNDPTEQTTCPRAELAKGGQANGDGSSFKLRAAEVTKTGPAFGRATAVARA